jgi:hypothetical protein
MCRKWQNTDAVRTWLSRSERTWASSVGGPGLNFGEHMAGRSMLGTIFFFFNEGKINRMREGMELLPKKPSPSRSSSGSEISALTPQTTVVFPIRTSADPFAVEIEPNLLIHHIIDPLLKH